MKRSGMPQWLVVLLVLAGLVFLGPPALGLFAGLVGLAIGLAAIALKVGLVALAIYAVVLLFRAIFGATPRPTGVQRVDPLEQELALARHHEAALTRDDEELRRLDAELARVMAQQKPA